MINSNNNLNEIIEINGSSSRVDHSNRDNRYFLIDKRLKYIICVFLNEVILSVPVYLHGLIIVSDNSTERIGWLMIWPTVLYLAIRQIIEFKVDKVDSSAAPLSIIAKSNVNDKPIRYRRYIVIVILISSLSIILTGIIIGSSISASDDVVIILIVLALYSVAASGLCLIRLKIGNLMTRYPVGLYRNIESLSIPFGQFLLPYYFTGFNSAYGSTATITLLGAFLLHTVPLNLITTNQTDINGLEEMKNSQIKDCDRYSDLPGFEINLNYETNLKIDPIPEPDPDEEIIHVYPERCVEKFLSWDGVEIMVPILEEDEPISMKSSESNLEKPNSSIILTNGHCRTIDDSQRNYFDSIGIIANRTGRFIKIYYNRFCDIIYKELINPMRRAMIIPRFYPAILLKSSEIFSYVFFLQLLPIWTIDHYDMKSEEIPFLLSTIAFPWILFSIIIRQRKLIPNKRMEVYYFIGGFMKFIGILFFYLARNKILLSFVIIFLGFGQAITYNLNGKILKSSFCKDDQWNDVRKPIRLSAGIMIIIYGFLAYLTLLNDGIGHCISYTAALYGFSAFTWFFVSKFNKCYINISEYLMK